MKDQNFVGWKVAFFSLLSVILLLVFITFLLFQRNFPEVSEEHFNQQAPGTEDAIFLIRTDKAKLNALIQKYIEQEDPDHPYIVEILVDKVQMRSFVKVLGRHVPVTINFAPEVVNTGDLLLKVETFSLGNLHLPVEQVLQFLSGWIELADWIVTYPKQKLVEVKLSEITVNEHNTIQFRFTIFDLEQDIIELEMAFS
ncbi:YpmS family protein [Halalkalibacter krulwichiae]|uniref:DUF2140 family protein n=1 Tax=Halalkalibacter krulwichiae TaxID=199441 RepID=A0A1X9M6W6_9BACI|nr:YpmS family protein [Halalkalibacter krulwichiae]ARK29166.1 hypothetical protein BkAM31D_04450 [Halalkalibacter krulwichiae]